MDTLSSQNPIRRINRRIAVSWLLYALAVIIHIPVSIYPHLFDKNIAPQFISIILISVIYSIYILRRLNNFLLHKYVFLISLYLIVSSIISAFLSGSVISSLTGDTGRYAGVTSLICLLLVAYYHSNFTKVDFKLLLRLYLILPVLQSCLGIFQHYELVEFPGAQGFSATLGNEDFFAAYIGVSAPLFIFAAYRATKILKYSFITGYLICIYALYEAGPLQAYVDLAITLIGIIFFKFRKYLPKFDFSLNIRNAIGTLLIIIWAQIIFLTPFLGHWIPTLGDDIQVKIRANFWLAGTKQFFDHPFFGVGPDQYGNYYEQYRTLTDAQNYTSILSNDAHSASVQTLATLGIFGMIAFLTATSLLIRSILILWDNQKIPRAETFLISLFFFVYLTNSFVSPLTLPTKVLFWAIAGWVIGNVYGQDMSRWRIEVRNILLIIIIFLTFVGSNFSFAQIKYSNAYETYAKNPNGKVDYKFNSYIPCFMYFDGQFNMVKNLGLPRLREIAIEQISINPRCVAAHLVLAQVAKAQGDLGLYRQEIYNLVQIAPSRSQVINLGFEYANENKDYLLLNRLKQIVKELNLIYVPGALG